MPSILPCLDNIIGLSKTTCNCWDASKPIDFNSLNASSSGLYVAEPSGIPLRWTNSAADCENGGIWQLLIDAREKAVRGFIADYLALQQKVKEEQFDPFNFIGDKYFAKFNPEPTIDLFASVWIEPYRLRGAKLTIVSIDIAFANGIAGIVNIPISIYSSLDLSTPIATATAAVNSINQYFTATFLTPVTIDLGLIRDDLNERLYFVYEIPIGTQAVLNNTYIIPCCGGSKGKEKENPYLQIMCLGGVQSSTILNLTSPTSSTATMQGLIINASLECDYYSWLCNLSQTPNAAYNINNGKTLRLGMGLADGLQAGAIMHLANAILMSGRINHFSMVLEDKQLYAIRGHYAKIYETAIKNMVYFMPASVTDCLKCATDSRIMKNEILI